ncbi:MAG: putative metal-dependent hydrolase [Glaciecola sp.]|jgi:predicted metal-dependent hydrolase
MTDLQIRKIPFDFDGDVPFLWNPHNPEFAIMCNAVGVLAIAFEKFVVATVKKAMPLITDPEVRAEADAFMRQEGQHARMHRAHITSLIRKYPGVQQTLDEAVAAFDELLETKPVEFNLAYTANLEATFTPIFKLFLDHHKTLYEPGDDRVASLFIWHFVEEVEHRSSALVLYREVVGSERARFRMLPEIFGHVIKVYAGAVRSFDEVIPAEDRMIDGTRALPSRMYRREIGIRLPWFKKRILAEDGHGTALQDASAGELIRMAIGLVKSQVPGHDPTHQPLPAFADEWFAAYDEGREVATWYASSRAAANSPIAEVA